MPASHSERIVQFVRDPALKSVELRYSQYDQPVFHRHNHDSYSIGLVKKGTTRFHLVQHSETVIAVNPGDVVLINPHEVHACNPEEGSVFAYYMLYLGQEYFRCLVEDITGYPGENFRFPLPVLRKDTIRRCVNRLCLSMMHGGSRLEIETALHETTAVILLCCGGMHTQPLESRHSADIQNGYVYLQEHLAENISLQELAALSNLSPFHFLRLFRRRYGLPPHTCQLQMRLNHARQLLAEGESIAATAAAVGFADQSHFTRAFRRSVGTTPLQYQVGFSTATAAIRYCRSTG
ncbi:MAG: AraC family transcriptional regulator [Leptolinea sp.]|jgi:AraC-like DNA-binding protein|nr:AraC family transcriptional regulator [Leptolinea sp.]